MSDAPYLHQTLLFQAVCGLCCFGCALWAVCGGSLSPAVGLVLSGLTNTFIAAEKWVLLRRKE